jgi:hypothetical protein
MPGRILVPPAVTGRWTHAAECELIAKAATDGAKRELYLRLGLHYRELVADMRAAIATKAAA